MYQSIFETALDQESEDQLGTFGEITSDKKSHATVPLMFVLCLSPSLLSTVLAVLPFGIINAFLQFCLLACFFICAPVLLVVMLTVCSPFLLSNFLLCFR